MPLPTGWPPRPATGRRSIRFYKAGTATALFPDNAYLFADGAGGANTFVPTPYIAPGSSAPVSFGTASAGGTPSGGSKDPHNVLPTEADQTHPQVWAQAILVRSLSGELYVSFDGINVHGHVPANETVIFRDRYEAGIAIKGAGDFEVEAW